MLWFPLATPSYRTQLGKLGATTEAPSASPTETRAWQDLRKFSGPSLSPGAQSVQAETLPTMFAQHVLKTSSDAEPLPPSLAMQPGICALPGGEMLIPPS